MNTSMYSCRRGLVASALAFILLAAACSDGKTEVTAGAGDDTSNTTTNDLPEDSVVDDTIEADPSGEWVRTTSRDDLAEATPANVIDVLADPSDDSRLLVRFEGAAEPCAGSSVVVTESADSIDVQLFQGLDPNAAAMTCIAQVFNYEIAVPLTAPVGDRELRVSAI